MTTVVTAVTVVTVMGAVDTVVELLWCYCVSVVVMWSLRYHFTVVPLAVVLLYSLFGHCSASVVVL